MTLTTDHPRVSIVIPVYNGALSIGRLCDELIVNLSPLFRIEIVLVNDCSPDKSEEVCIAITKKHPDFVSFYSLARNVGEHNTVMAGLNMAGLILRCRREATLGPEVSAQHGHNTRPLLCAVGGHTAAAAPAHAGSRQAAVQHGCSPSSPPPRATDASRATAMRQLKRRPTLHKCPALTRQETELHARQAAR